MSMSQYWSDARFKSAKRSVVNDEVRLECPYCDGEGEHVGSHRSDCSECKGLGHVSIEKFKAKIAEADRHDDHERQIELIRMLARKLKYEQLPGAISLLQALIKGGKS